MLFGLSLALMITARLGLGPWDVLHQGIEAAGRDPGAIQCILNVSVRVGLRR
ncbi:MAG: hypothetical protein M3N98_13665 [Actinomycetota bacterium]|nr:hypothetical protein [Actinomycetota bacterium]